MSFRLSAVAGLLSVGALAAWSAPSRAQSTDETAFGLGQFIGSAVFCKVPRDKVDALAATLLKASGIDASGPSPIMTRFTAGVTDGAQAMQKPDAPPCSDVVAAFNEAYAKTQ